MKETIHLYMPDGGQDGVIQAWLGSWPEWRWVEFRGPPYAAWDPYATSNFQCIHDALPGWHACVLHTDQVLDVLPKHPEYEYLIGIVDYSNRWIALPP